MIAKYPAKDINQIQFAAQSGFWSPALSSACRKFTPASRRTLIDLLCFWVFGCQEQLF
jgi:hypothetical protein